MRASRVLELRMANRLGEIAGVIETFGAFAEENGLDQDVRRIMNLALDDLLNNIVSYAYGDDGEHWIDIRVRIKRDQISATIEDEGQPFDPFERAAPDTTLSLDEREIGGLGIHLVRELMDEASYVRRTNRNVVTIAKHLVQWENRTDKEKSE